MLLAAGCGSTHGGQSGTDESGLGKSNEMPPAPTTLAEPPGQGEANGEQAQGEANGEQAQGEANGEQAQGEPSEEAEVGSSEESEPLEPTGTLELIELTDQNNYRGSTEATLPTIEISPATDGQICWDELTTALDCAALDPAADIDMLVLTRYSGSSVDEVTQDFAAGTLLPTAIINYEVTTPRTCAPLSGFSAFGTPVDVMTELAREPESPHLLHFQSGTQAGMGVRSAVFIELSEESSNTQVTAPAGCGLMTTNVDLGSSTPVELSKDGPWRIDWSQVSESATGTAMPTVSQIRLSFYEGMSTGTAEDQFVALDGQATEEFVATVSGESSLDLAQAVSSESGEEFAGFGEKEGLWLFSAECEGCQPLPPLVTVLIPGN